MSSSDQQSSAPTQLTWVSGLEKQRKKRFSSKTRSGCETCKRRRIKCDEGKPACVNCIRSSRKCEGYQSLASNQFYWHELDIKEFDTRRATRSTTVSFSRSIDPKYGNAPRDKELLDLFLSTIAIEIVKFSNPYFWYKLVPQVSWEYESVRHAVAAVALACAEVCPDLAVIANRSTRPQSLYHYNAAIRSLTTVKKGKAPPTDVVLMCCVLFWVFENLKNRSCVAMTHLKAAVNMLNERPRPPSHQDDLTSTYIEPLLQESMVFAATVLPTGGRKHHDAPATTAAFEAAVLKLQPSETPKDILTCRYDFSRCQQALLMAKQMQMSSSSPDPDMSIVRTLYADWRTALDNNAHRFPPDFVRMLRMHHSLHMLSLDIVAYDMIGVNIRESSDWRTRQRFILDEARYFVRFEVEKHERPAQPVAINLSLITLLAVLARQCDPKDDDQAAEAIGLLRDNDWFEGMWGSNTAGELVHLMRKIDAEHEFCRTGDLEAVFERAAKIGDDEVETVPSTDAIESDDYLVAV